MSTHGIYQKTCPACVSQVPIDEQRCHCGYSFLGTGNTEELTADELDAQQQLEQEYIRARIVQASESLEALRTALSVDPKNLDKANNVMRAFADVRDLRTELQALSSPNVDLIAATDKAIEASMSQQAPAAFRAAQAEKAEKIMQAAGIATKECDKCHAVLPERAVLCFCGYVFSGVDAATLIGVNADTEQPQTGM